MYRDSRPELFLKPQSIDKRHSGRRLTQINALYRPSTNNLIGFRNASFPPMKGTFLVAFISLVLPAKAELTRDGAFDLLVDASLYQTKCYGYVSPAAKAALNRLGNVYDINLSVEIDAERAVDRMTKRSLEIDQGPAALANFCAREKREVEELDKIKHSHPH